ncbi:MAG: Slp family lipoprotein [Pseudomonadota bacterium]|mgnify:FL=1
MKPYLLLPYLLLSACAGLPSAVRDAPAVNVSYYQASRDINGYKDTPVRWGGVIVDVANETHSSLMQVLFYPLDYSGRPQLQKQSEGRFVVESPEFLDPAVYAKDKEITIAGVIKGDIERTVGKRIIRVLLLSATAIYLWQTYHNYYDYHYRGYGAYPYFGYPGFYPFYPGGFYGPYYRW